eukprot:CAMPEP_0117510634 /NCGR_PEP_ID=MMETSP0784-20121206/28089_1 /TAXON_ID=39447 /ORGANISM="" /LENGTH=190 /DNA_ID=CAMNT_0005306273 /DNA_START=22 /DNA_END=591 /DNA_ORIENTATION=+
MASSRCAMAKSRRAQRIVTSALMCVAVLLLGSSGSAGTIGFVAPPTAHGRRQATLSSLFSVAAPLAAASQFPSESHAITLAGEEKDYKKATQATKNGLVTQYTKDDLTITVVEKTNPAALKKVAADVTSPFWRGPPGVNVLKYEIGDARSDFEYVQFPLTSSLTAPTAFANVFGGEIPTKYQHWWYRTVT